jgi:hypothetical protein
MSSAELPAGDLSGRVIGSGQPLAPSADVLIPHITDQVAWVRGRARARVIERVSSL